MQFKSSSHPRGGRAGSEHQGQCPYIFGGVGYHLGARVGHPCPTVVTYSAPNTIFGHLNRGLGVVRWCAHRLQQLGPPWGTGPICPHTPGITGHCLITLGDHTHHHRSHTQRRRHHIRRFELRYGGVRCGGSVVVCPHHGIGGLGVHADGDGVG